MPFSDGREARLRIRKRAADGAGGDCRGRNRLDGAAVLADGQRPCVLVGELVRKFGRIELHAKPGRFGRCQRPVGDQRLAVRAKAGHQHDVSAVASRSHALRGIADRLARGIATDKDVLSDRLERNGFGRQHGAHGGTGLLGGRLTNGVLRDAVHVREHRGANAADEGEAHDQMEKLLHLILLQRVSASSSG